MCKSNVNKMCNVPKQQPNVCVRRPIHIIKVSYLQRWRERLEKEKERREDYKMNPMESGRGPSSFLLAEV